MIADVPLSKFNDRLQSSRRYRVFESRDGIYQVQVPDTSVKYIVNLQKRRCYCTNFSEYESPCTHAIVACRHKAEDPYDLFYLYFTVSSYRKTYKHFLKPISIKNLSSAAGLLPPVFKKQCGRPRIAMAGALPYRTMYITRFHSSHNQQA